MSADEAEVAYRLFDESSTRTEVAAKLSVSRFSVSRALERRPGTEPAELPLEGEAGAAQESHLGEDEAPVRDAEVSGDEDESEGGETERSSEEAGAGARIETGEVHSRYAGAMLLHDFLSGIDAAEILSSLPRAVARRYDAPAVMPSATFGFVLGSSSADDTLHLARADAGALVGSASFPELRTLRPRLAGIAEQSDPLALSAAPSRKRCSQQTSVPRSSTSSMTTSSPIPAPERSQGAGTPGSAQPSGDGTTPSSSTAPGGRSALRPRSRRGCRSTSPR